jgi:hypothetical protein
MRETSTRRPALLALLTAVLTSVAIPAPTTASPAAPATPAEKPVAPPAVSPDRADSTPQYSSPTWFPLRNPSVVHCVKTNCEGPYHDHWAIDLLGDPGDPIHAAGAGIAYIGQLAPGCTTDRPRAGTWIWIDHGGGTITRYFHLDDVLITHGQHVTPRTQIGTMGNSGAQEPCDGAYLHFEIRQGGLDGTYEPIPSMRACTATGPITLPEQLGYNNWDHIPWDVPGIARVTTPSVTSSCIPTSFPTPEPPAVTVDRGDETITATLTATAGRRTVALLEVWRPTANRFAPVGYRYTNGTTATITWPQLLNGRQHRVTAATENAAGWSTWTTPITITPGRPPAPPKLPRSLSWSRSRISIGWHRSERFGSTITGYDIAIRAQPITTQQPWNITRGGNVSRHTFLELTPGRTYQIKVRARSTLGASGWSDTVNVRTDPTPNR